MTSPKTDTLKTSILVALLVILNSAGNFFFGLGMKRIGAIHGWSMAALHSAFVAIFSSVWIWLGIVSMLLFMLALMLVLSWADFQLCPARDGVDVRRGSTAGPFRVG